MHPLNQPGPTDTLGRLVCLGGVTRRPEYIKRLIIKLERPVGRDLYLRWYEKLQGSMLSPELYELPRIPSSARSPGYQNVRLRHHEFQHMISNDEPDALSSVKGVYVITDLSNGRLSVGSASGKSNGLWRPWST